MSVSVSLANGGDQGKRRALDFYPTPADVTVALLDFLDLAPCTVWEPACGDGAMARVIEARGHSVMSSDIREDSGFGEPGVDFLRAVRACDAIITNPPFKVSGEFIEHALTQAPIVAMVLKSQYWHARKRAALFAKHPPAWVLPLTWRPDFLAGERGGSPTMEVHWTVWMHGRSESRYQPLLRPSAGTLL